MATRPARGRSRSPREEERPRPTVHPGDDPPRLPAPGDAGRPDPRGLRRGRARPWARSRARRGPRPGPLTGFGHRRPLRAAYPLADPHRPAGGRRGAQPRFRPPVRLPARRGGVRALPRRAARGAGHAPGHGRQQPGPGPAAGSDAPSRGTTGALRPRHARRGPGARPGHVRLGPAPGPPLGDDAGGHAGRTRGGWDVRAPGCGRAAGLRPAPGAPQGRRRRSCRRWRA